MTDEQLEAAIEAIENMLAPATLARRSR